MKRIIAVILTLLCCILFSVMSFADDIYIVDDGEDAFVPDIPTTTTAPAETTTAASDSGSIFGDISFGDYFSGLSGLLGDGLDSIMQGFDQLSPNANTAETTQPSLPVLDSGERPTMSQQSDKMTVEGEESYTGQQQNVTEPAPKEEELPSVLIVNGTNEKDTGISGSTLTLLVFVAAVVILILIGAIVLVLMTRRTEYNSTVMDKSTIPSVEKPRAMSQFTNDNIDSDGNDYGNIAYWNDNSGDN